MSRIATLSKKTDKTQNVQVTRKCGGRPVPVGVPGGAAPCPNKGKPCPPCTRGKPPVPTTSRTQISRRNVSTGLGKSLAHVRPSDEGLEAPSLLQKRVFKQALAKSVRKPGQKVRSVGASLTDVKDPMIKTNRGKECVLQQMKMETTVQRTPKAEYITKSMTGIDVGPSGVGKQLQITTHQIDPAHGTESAGVNETISATSSLSITSGGRKLQKGFKRKTLISEKLASKPNMNPHHINRLIKEETEDVETTLKMVPPDLATTSLEKFPLKKKLQNLRLNAEPVSILTESVIHPAPTADEVDAEAPPEILASVMDAVEKGATPATAPNQIFNSLFPEVEEPRINISSVAPGPLEDIVVPTAQPVKLVEEVLTQEMEEFLVLEIQSKKELPRDDICADKNIIPAAYSPEEIPPVPLVLEGELPPWEDATVVKLSSLVGADPMDMLEASDISILESPEDLNQELSKGIDYFIDADVAPYETKIQIRGSKPPKWFPGYMSAFPHLPELVKISTKPSEVLHAAWKAVQPKVFPDESILIV
ncbi:hypothetical protein Zmor_026380 [Zophobas morio]|uniref:Uncharacterized protein n=1 Tax=Zophobas morio TaxID=2755281 RepID=A0AA38HTU7_9CUCU|nr:hypothetical protein Zmor_026380 [Zophobas morio]